MSNADEILPFDKWLVATEIETGADVAGARERDANRDSVNPWEADLKTTQQQTDAASGRNGQADTLGLEAVVAAALALTSRDRQRLVSRIRFSLPNEQRAASTAIRAILWRTLFDPSNTSELYSAPRRFDLATIFVVMAAYSLLFGALAGLDALPIVKIFVGGLLAIVAVAQAFFLNVYSPRGVSIATAIPVYTSFVIWMWSAYPRSFPGWLVVLMLLVGPPLGYIAGVLVGGVFLVADLVRKKFLTSALPQIADRDVSNSEKE